MADDFIVTGALLGRIASFLGKGSDPFNSDIPDDSPPNYSQYSNESLIPDGYNLTRAIAYVENQNDSTQFATIQTIGGTLPTLEISADKAQQVLVGGKIQRYAANAYPLNFSGTGPRARGFVDGNNTASGYYWEGDQGRPFDGSGADGFTINTNQFGSINLTIWNNYTTYGIYHNDVLLDTLRVGQATGSAYLFTVADLAAGLNQFRWDYIDGAEPISPEEDTDQFRSAPISQGGELGVWGVDVDSQIDGF